MRRDDMRVGMRVTVRIPTGNRRGPREASVLATVTRPFAVGMSDCTDVRLANGEDRMVHCERIEALPPPPQAPSLQTQGPTTSQEQP